jgi:hypothetical protein
MMMVVKHISKFIQENSQVVELVDTEFSVTDIDR